MQSWLNNEIVMHFSLFTIFTIHFSFPLSRKGVKVFHRGSKGKAGACVCNGERIIAEFLGYCLPRRFALFAV